MKKSKVMACVITSLICSPAFAFHAMDCTSADHKVTATYLSDAKFGNIESATLTYDGSEKTFSLADAPADGTDSRYSLTRNHIAIIPFKTGENIVLGAGESSVFAFDKDGMLLGNLTCWLHGFPP